MQVAYKRKEACDCKSCDLKARDLESCDCKLKGLRARGEDYKKVRLFLH